MIRTFIALPIPEEVKASLGGAMEQLKAKNPAVRWVRPAGLHITLKFLGDIKDEIVAPLSADLDRATSSCPWFDLALAGFGAFPNVRRPRVVWVGLEGSMQDLLDWPPTSTGCALPTGLPGKKGPLQGITLGRLKPRLW
jgi:2'-5' RNA ligase